jgi:hypothetical protein
MGKEHGLERWAASGANAEEGGARGMRDVAARRRSGRICFAEHLFERE